MTYRIFYDNIVTDRPYLLSGGIPVHLSKRSIFIGSMITLLGAAIFELVRPPKPRPVSIDLVCLTKGMHVEFRDVEGFTWEIHPEGESAYKLGGYLVGKVIVTSTNPEYLEEFGDCSRGNFMRPSYVSRVVQEGSDFTLYLDYGETHSTPQVAVGSLRLA